MQVKNVNNDEPVAFKRILTLPFGLNKHITLSIASSKLFSLTQFGVVMYDDRRLNRYPISGAIRMTAHACIQLHKLLSWVVVRLRSNEDTELTDEERSYIETVKRFWTDEAEAQVIQEEEELGFLPSHYDGQSYDEFPQLVEHQKKNR